MRRYLLIAAALIIKHATVGLFYTKINKQAKSLRCQPITSKQMQIIVLGFIIRIILLCYAYCLQHSARFYSISSDTHM